MAFDAEKELAKARAAGGDKIQRRIAKHASDRSNNRASMPEVAKIVDHVTATFGKVKVTGAIDYGTGHKVGHLP